MYDAVVLNTNGSASSSGIKSVADALTCVVAPPNPPPLLIMKSLFAVVWVDVTPSLVS